MLFTWRNAAGIEASPKTGRGPIDRHRSQIHTPISGLLLGHSRAAKERVGLPQWSPVMSPCASFLLAPAFFFEAPGLRDLLLGLEASTRRPGFFGLGAARLGQVDVIPFKGKL